MRRPRSMSGGFTLLEILVAVGIAGVMLACVASWARPHHARRAASATRALLVWARAQAAWTGHDYAVVEDPDGVIVRRSDRTDPGAACTAAPASRRLRWRSYPGVRVVRPLRDGIVWLATGGALSCSGGGVISDRLSLTDGEHAYDIVVSSLGRVRLEATP